MATRRRRRATAAAYFAIDLIVVLLFVVAGRDTRGHDAVGTLLESLPFFAGATLGWLITRAWRNPRSVLPTGIVIWFTTAVVGLAVRSVIGNPTDSRFVFITFVALGMFLIGWRGLAWILDALFGRAIEKPVDAKYRR